MKKITDVKELKEVAKDVRKDIIKMLEKAGSGHPGGSLSEVELLTALYFNFMDHDPDNQSDKDRDRFVLSKGHGCPALYSVMARSGYFPVEELQTLRQLGSRLQGHTDKTRLPVLECSAGSLGQGLSIAVGMALASKLNKQTNSIYCMCGDGEVQEGNVWEAVEFASFHKLNNLCIIIDKNNIQLDGFTKDILDIDPLDQKYKQFNLNVLSINGHDFNEILEAFNNFKKTKNKPTLIVANTVKGKGVSFMENDPHWHGVAPNKEEAEKALEELKCS